LAWFQKSIQIPSKGRGFHTITGAILDAVPEVRDVRVGLLHVFLQHTSAALTINENADPDVPADLDRVLDSLAPEDFPYRHTCEGPDDMPGHAKAMLLGPSVTVPIRNGQLCLGTWQGIFLCEFRRHTGPRRLVITVEGQ